MAKDTREHLAGIPGKAQPAPVQAPMPAPAPAKVQAPVPQPVPEAPVADHVLRAELDQLRAENARLKTQQLAAAPSEAANRGPVAFGTQKLRTAVDPTAPAQPAEPDPAFAIGEPGPGKRLWLVHLPGCKSRVVEPERGVAVMLDRLPVWATNQGEAYMIFARYNGIRASVQQPSFSLMEPAAA